MHYLISNALDLTGYENFAVDVSNYNDVSELFLVSDCLITDYSSVMFDYGILKRPQFFFAYDIDKYDKGLRGFYMDYMKDLPGPIYTEPYGLAKKLKDLDKVQDEYQDQIDAFMIDSVQLMMVKLLNISESLFTKISKKTSRNIIFIYKAVTNFIVTVCFYLNLRKFI